MNITDSIRFSSEVESWKFISTIECRGESMSKSTQYKPIRAGIFASVEHAEDAIRKLLDAGFDANEISVVCSEEVKLGHFEALHLEDEESESKRSVVVNAGFAGGASN